ncbi:MAG TPA: histone deacetylase family protein [Longimicrobiales bacterium]|nr:histone deacetylase family protein [Longimicrobiales bacterium]
MVRIRRIYDDVNEHDRQAIAAAQQILRAQFPGVDEAVVSGLAAQLRDPLRSAFRSILFVAESLRGRVQGFALLHHAPDLRFCYLDFIAAATGGTGGGVGGALYARVREEARALGCVGIFLEALPDDPALCPNPDVVRQNAARLRFYERFGAYPIVGTAYETPLAPGGQCPPLLVFDDLGSGRPLRRDTARRIVRAILERRYAGICPPEYVERVVDSIRDDPVRLRPPRYTRPRGEPVRVEPQPMRIPLVVNEGHAIHHVRERGYVEAPVRISAILREIEPTGLFERIAPRHFGDDHILAVHDADFVRYLRRIGTELAPDDLVYPYVFPIRNKARLPEDLAIRSGYYCIDTFTPLSRSAFAAARAAVDCALTAADAVLQGEWLAYALVRPPGHHAERRAFGGFCYFNSTAIAAHYLGRHGRVAILDVDYHHGNGQQEIFYERDDVLTVSIHGHPRFAYPYFAGFADETGAGRGVGFNLNLPQPERLDGAGFRAALLRALRAVADFDPRFLVVALGLDPARGDPTGTWALRAEDFERNGQMIGATGLPILVVQEGGYRTRSLGVNARRFFAGLHAGARTARENVEPAGAPRKGRASRVPT